MESREAQVQSSIAPVADHRLNEFKDNRWGLFGFFEAERDSSVAGNLFAAAEVWLREHGRDRMLGPLDTGSTNDCWNRTPLPPSRRLQVTNTKPAVDWYPRITAVPAARGSNASPRRTFRQRRATAK